VSARVEPCRDDVFLLCSDGLSNKVSATEMQQIVVDNFDDLGRACAELVKLANENGGEDNITVVIAKCIGDGLAEPSEDGVKLELIDLGGIHDTADQELGEETTEIM
jgi:protein phosphatase